MSKSRICFELHVAERASFKSNPAYLHRSFYDSCSRTSTSLALPPNFRPAPSRKSRNPPPLRLRRVYLSALSAPTPSSLRRAPSVAAAAVFVTAFKFVSGALRSWPQNRRLPTEKVNSRKRIRPVL